MLRLLQRIRESRAASVVIACIGHALDRRAVLEPILAVNARLDLWQGAQPSERDALTTRDAQPVRAGCDSIEGRRQPSHTRPQARPGGKSALQAFGGLDLIDLIRE